jgi:hypothetical protein
MRSLVAVALVGVLAGCASAPPIAPTATVSPVEALQRSPFDEPPGVLNADVQQANIETTICVARWTTTVRPPTSYTDGLKHQMLQRVGIDVAKAKDYELDHFVPLALGGHPRSTDNLWLQKWDGEWNAKIKDRLERKLQVMVCAGHISLNDARDAIRSDWKAAFRKYVEHPQEMEAVLQQDAAD